MKHHVVSNKLSIKICYSVFVWWVGGNCTKTLFKYHNYYIRNINYIYLCLFISSTVLATRYALYKREKILKCKKNIKSKLWRNSYIETNFLCISKSLNWSQSPFQINCLSKPILYHNPSISGWNKQNLWSTSTKLLPNIFGYFLFQPGPIKTLKRKVY